MPPIYMYTKPMETLANIHIQLFETQGEWESWLEINYDEQIGRWLKIAKKASGLPSVSYAEALDVALCYGWIDGQKKSYDDQYFLQKFTPRRPRSIWSKVNVQKVENLTAAGKMQPSGIDAVVAAKVDGRWANAYDSHRTITMPADFQKALDINPKAKAFYDTLNKTNTYGILFRIQTAKKPETRQAYIEKFIIMLENEEKLH